MRFCDRSVLPSPVPGTATEVKVNGTEPLTVPGLVGCRVTTRLELSLPPGARLVIVPLLVSREPVDGVPTIKSSHLVLKAKIPGVTNEKFQELAKGAEQGCPVSRVLKAEISLDATLV